MAPDVDVLAVHVPVGSDVAVLGRRGAIPPPAAVSEAFDDGGSFVDDLDTGDAGMAVVFMFVLDASVSAALALP